MPAEYDEHYGCVMIFPERADSWQFGGYAARKAFAAVAAAISASEKVTVLASARQYRNARDIMPPEIRVVETTTDDAWARDVAPTFVRSADGEVRGVDWCFNAWGGLTDGLYFPWDNDNKAAMKICDLLEKDVYNAQDFVLEGGSIHSDGEGTVLVTEACLLSHGRNPQMSKAEIEQRLRDYLGAEKIIWLRRGIYSDETNEHVDNICAFVKPAEVVLAWTDDKDDPQYEMSLDCLNILESSVDARGRAIKVHKLMLPKPVCITAEECAGLDNWDGVPTRTAGERLAASYVNFYIANKAVIVPQFGDPADTAAISTLAALFPEREIIPIAARDILIGGGNIHCITQQIPKWRNNNA